MPMDYQDMGRRIRGLRVIRNMTQEKMASAIGVTPSYIGHLERGTRTASLETLVQLCDILHTSPSYLLASSLSDSLENYQQNLVTSSQAKVMRDVIRTISENLDHWVSEPIGQFNTDAPESEDAPDENG